MAEHTFREMPVTELYVCRTCGGAEGTLPTECPGESMTIRVAERVYAGALDFVNGNWVQHAIKGLVIRMDYQGPLNSVGRWRSPT